MTSPSWQAITETIETSWTKTHTINLPAAQPGDHVLVSWGMAGSGITVTPPAGWTEIVGINLFPQTDTLQWYVWIKEIDGSEASTITVTTSRNNQSAAHAIRVKGARAGVVEGTTWDVATTSSGYGTVLDPPSVTATWGSADQLFVALGYAGGYSSTVTAFPSGFSNTNDATAGAMVCSATKEATATSDDPSSFTISNSNNHRAATIVLRPALSVIAGAEAATGTGTASDATCDPPTVVASAEVATGVGEAFWATTPEIPVSSDLTMEWDLDGDGDFDQAIEDRTDDVIAGELMYGRSYASQITGRSIPGTMSVVVKNDDNQYNFFNQDSPLNTAPYSLKGGRYIRLRDSSATPADPVEIAHDLFAGDGGPLTTTDTGDTWTTRLAAGFSQFSDQALADGPPAAGLSEVDPGAYTWASLENNATVTDCLRPASGEAISLRSSSETTVTGTASSHTITLPATIENNDLIWIVCSTQDSTDAGAPATPSGYTQRWSLGHAAAFRPRITCVYKIADGTEDSDVITFDWSPTTTETHIVALVFDGVDTTTPFDVTQTGPTDGTTDPDPAAITPASGGSWVLVTVVGQDTPTTATPTISSGFTSLFDQSPDLAAFSIIYQAQPQVGTEHIETIDAGDTTYYAQIDVPFRDSDNEIGICYHYTDTDNYGLLVFADKELCLKENVAGSLSTLATTPMENRDDIAIGINVAGTAIKAYLDGVEELSATSALSATNHVGLYGKWFSQRPPTVGSFRVWDGTRIGFDDTGILGTLRVSKVEPFTTRDNRKLAQITARGELRALEREIACPCSVGADDLLSEGIRSGHLIGNILNQVGQLHPPAAIAEGEVQLGSVGFSRQRALNLARGAEETEIGFLRETPAGDIEFDDRSARDGTSVVATFTDDPEVPGFAFEVPRQRAWEADIINQVRSEVSPSMPRLITSTDSNVTALGVANDVDIVVPSEGTGDTDAAVGDLMLVVIASSVQADDVFWLNPAGWTNLRALVDEIGTRVYAKRLSAGDFGDTVQFYDDGSAGGAWAAAQFLVKNWYGVIESGLSITEFNGHGSGSTQALAGDNDPPVAFTPWPSQPSLFIALRTGLGATGSGATQQSASDDIAPNGYESLGSLAVAGSANAQDVGVQWAERTRTEQVSNPSPFGGEFTGYNLVETAVITIRGFAGDPPPDTGGFGVTDNNTASQLDREAILSHPHPGQLFATIADAETYNNLILERFDQDRPIFDVGFSATRDVKVRDMILARRLSDRVRIDADGNSGYGFDQEFFIEQIRYTWGAGARNLSATFSCSPATDSGGGAD